ncbi:hypothetical protein LEL_10706 [Akanthomyces lecanii RCEF 1005]|uniref:F-box domain-containing protein n=1 Tax=Akanthomyces lecanii RCEF 1005 TaxID=1081108 RepID=A0A167W244_CORDF|nr:hypothetical protein LEL_10706 [Akanthomyces lecanii RCEF 1005]
MAAVAAKFCPLGTLPMQIFLNVVRYLEVIDIKELSWTSKGFREACLPALFRHVRFEFVQDGAERLKCLLASGFHEHVAFFTCKVKERLSPNFDRLLLDEAYGISASYRAAYKELKDIYGQQCSNETVGSLMSEAFCALPRLREVRLVFCQAPNFDHNFEESKILMENDYFQHNLEIVEDAIQNARKNKVDIHTIILRDMNLPHHFPRGDRDLTGLKDILEKLLKNTKNVRLSGSYCVLELLSRQTLALHKLDESQPYVANSARESLA